MDARVADAIFWIAAACCSVAQIAIVRSAVAAPVTEPLERGLPRPRRASEVVWTIVPAIGLAVLLVVTWRAIQHAPRAATVPAVSAGAGGMP